MMVDSAEFWISCQRLKILRKASSTDQPSTIVWHQCDIRIFTVAFFLKKTRTRNRMGILPIYYITTNLRYFFFRVCHKAAITKSTLKSVCISKINLFWFCPLKWLHQVFMKWVFLNTSIYLFCSTDYQWQVSFRSRNTNRLFRWFWILTVRVYPMFFHGSCKLQNSWL